jgi:hypothetical protein
MVVEGSLVGELLIEHEFGRILGINVELVNETPGFRVRGSDECIQLGSELLFMTRLRLKVNVKDDWSFSHRFP